MKYNNIKIYIIGYREETTLQWHLPRICWEDWRRLYRG